MTHPRTSTAKQAVPVAQDVLQTTQDRHSHRRTGGPSPHLIRAAATLMLTLVVAVLLPTSAQAATAVSGNVTCVDGRGVVGVWVDASNGGSGWATRSNINGSTQRYSYNLPNGGTYSVRVGCGGTPANWATSNSSGSVSGTSNSFTCYDVPNYGYAYLRCQRT